MISVISGHLGSGEWRFKNTDATPILANIQPLNKETEFRIGSDQVIGYDIEKEERKSLVVKINFTQDRYCRAIMQATDLTHLDAMVSSNEAAPAYIKNDQNWIKGILLFLVICLAYEFLK